MRSNAEEKNGRALRQVDNISVLTLKKGTNGRKPGCADRQSFNMGEFLLLPAVTTRRFIEGKACKVVSLTCLPVGEEL